MTAALAAPVEVVQTHADDADDVAHWVCHCTDNDKAACGLIVEGRGWAADDVPDCPLCVLAWNERPTSCPWGCSCEECAP